MQSILRTSNVLIMVYAITKKKKTLGGGGVAEDRARRRDSAVFFFFITDNQLAQETTLLRYMPATAACEVPTSHKSATPVQCLAKVREHI